MYDVRGGGGRGVEAAAERALGAGWAAVDAVAAAGARGGGGPAREAAAAAQEALRRAAAAVAGLRELAEDLPEGSEEQDRLQRGARKHQGTLRVLREDLRRAARASGRRALEQVEADRRELLGRQGGDLGKMLTEAERESDFLAQSRGINEALHRARDAMARELEQGGATVEAMGIGNRALKRTNEKYEDQTGALGTGQRLLKALKDADNRETVKLYAAFAFFVLVAIFVVGRRAAYFVPWSAVRKAAGFGAAKAKGNGGALDSLGGRDL